MFFLPPACLAIPYFILLQGDYMVRQWVYFTLDLVIKFFYLLKLIQLRLIYHFSCVILIFLWCSMKNWIWIVISIDMEMNLNFEEVRIFLQRPWYILLFFFKKNDIVFNLYCDKFYIFYPCGYFQIFNFQFLLLCFQINLQLINIIHHFSAVMLVVKIFYHLWGLILLLF